MLWSACVIWDGSWYDADDRTIGNDDDDDNFHLNLF